MKLCSTPTLSLRSQKKDVGIERRIRGMKTGITVISVGEICFGIRNSKMPEKNEKTLNYLLIEHDVITPDIESARLFGDIFSMLKKKGRIIPLHDMWISAMALRLGVPVITRDRHFEEIQELDLVSW